MRVNALRAVGTRVPRLLACDLDGTLLDETGAVRPTVKAAIDAVKSAGVEVVLATGRNPWAVAETARILDLPGPHIVMNGGAYMSPITGEVVWTRTLDPDLVADALAFARWFGAAPLLGFLQGHASQRDGRESAVVPDFAVGPRLRHVDSLDALADLGPIRIYVPTEPRDHARAVAEATDWFRGRASIVYGDEFGLEIMAPNTNKGEALRAVAASMGIARDRVAAMGDAPNDREMLAFAGRSAVLLPGPGSLQTRAPALRGVTRVVPSSAEDGAVVAIRQFFPDLEFGPQPERFELEPDLSAA
jgi:Cof subfamily protein (haloacid dehalogenase superfamily)